MSNEAIVKSELIKRFEKATKTQKAALVELFGEDYFEVNITDRIKSFEDACEVLGCTKSLPDVSMFPDKHQKSILAYYKLIVIVEALNEGWTPNWKDENEYKYYPWFKVLSSGFGFSNSYYGYGLTGTAVGSRLCFKSRDLSDYAGKQFVEIYNDYLLY